MQHSSIHKADQHPRPHPRPRSRSRPCPGQVLPLQPMPLPLPRVVRRYCHLGLALLVFWMLAILAGPVLLAHKLVVLPASAHGFVDVRAWAGIPHAMDVLSNLPILLMGLVGLAAVKGLRSVSVSPETRQALVVFFVGLVLTSLGSAWYHWAPDANGLVWDRLGMAVAFSGVLSLAVAERVGRQAAALTLRLVLVVAAMSAVLPFAQGNVLPWGVVQFGGMALMVWVAWQKPCKTAMGIRLGLVVLVYALAKLLELGDAAVFQASGELVSGHSLKHLVASLAAWPVAQAMRQNARTAGANTALVFARAD